MKFDWTQGTLAEGLRCYRAGEFFEAHEHWEIVWLALTEPEKTFLQALIQVAAAFHHYRRGNLRGTLSLLQTALRRFENFPEHFGGIHLQSLRGDIRKSLEILHAQGSSVDLDVPRIERSE